MSFSPFSQNGHCVTIFRISFLSVVGFALVSPLTKGNRWKMRRFARISPDKVEPAKFPSSLDDIHNRHAAVYNNNVYSLHPSQKCQHNNIIIHFCEVSLLHTRTHMHTHARRVVFKPSTSPRTDTRAVFQQNINNLFSHCVQYLDG